MLTASSIRIRPAYGTLLQIVEERDRNSIEKEAFGEADRCISMQRPLR